MPDVTGGTGRFGGASSRPGKGKVTDRGREFGTSSGGRGDASRPTSDNRAGSPGKSTSTSGDRNPFDAKSGPGGGTTTQNEYVPGAVQNFPEADALTVFEKIFAPLVPGVGSGLGAATAAKMLMGDEDASKPTTVLGGDPGPQRGFQPDRYRGSASLGGLGGSGGAVADSRDIPGRAYGAGTQALTGDSDGAIAPGTEALWSDVQLRDRRKPKGFGAGTDMMMAAA